MSPTTPNPNKSNSPSDSPRQVSSPWTQIVRGESAQSDPIDPIGFNSHLMMSDEKSEESGGLSNVGKKQVWNKPSNGVPEVVHVMGASAWPALSEAIKAPSNKSSSDSLKSLGDVPSVPSVVPVSQGVAIASVTTPKQIVCANLNNPTPNNTRQKSFNKRNAASGSAANGTTVSQPTAQVSFPVPELHSHNPSPRGQNQRNNSFSSPTHQNGNNHHGGRRNQDHQNWNFNRSFNGREGNGQSPRGAPSFIRHAPPPVQPIPQFMATQPIQPFGSPVPFPPELAAQYYPRMPFMGPISPAPMFYHVQDPPLNMKIQNQIHYYFSEDNLIRDTFLRGFMDDQGFVPLRLVAGFKKVAGLTDSIPEIVEALQGSPFVEIQGDGIRKRHNWQHWLLPKGTSSAGLSPRSVGQSSQMKAGEPAGSDGQQGGANR